MKFVLIWMTIDIYLNNYILKSVLYLLIKNVGLIGSNGMTFFISKPCCPYGATMLQKT